MSVKSVALTVIAVSWAILLLPAPALPAGGMRALPVARFAPPLMVRPPHPRAGLLRPSPRFGYGSSPSVQAFREARRRFHIPPSPHGFGTTTPARPFAHLMRRSHRIYHAGWYFPVTIGGDIDAPGFIGVPYDPAETIPVYGPLPAADQIDPPVPAPTAAPVNARLGNAGQNTAQDATPGAVQEPRDACRSEQVTVPAGEGERTIRVVRC
jgi:hypothetical protein